MLGVTEQHSFITAQPWSDIDPVDTHLWHNNNPFLRDRTGGHWMDWDRNLAGWLAGRLGETCLSGAVSPQYNIDDLNLCGIGEGGQATACLLNHILFDIRYG